MECGPIFFKSSGSKTFTEKFNNFPMLFGLSSTSLSVEEDSSVIKVNTGRVVSLDKDSNSLATNCDKG